MKRTNASLNYESPSKAPRLGAVAIGLIAVTGVIAVLLFAVLLRYLQHGWLTF